MVKESYEDQGGDVDQGENKEEEAILSKSEMKMLQTSEDQIQA